MYCKIKVISLQSCTNFPAITLSRVEGAPKREEHSDIPRYKEPRSMDVEKVAREISGSECEGQEPRSLYLYSLSLGKFSAESVSRRRRHSYSACIRDRRRHRSPE